MAATTICAIASPPGAGPRAVLRLSGPRAGEILAACCRSPAGEPVPPGGRAHTRVRFDDGRFRDGRGAVPARLLWMPGPRSFTREDVGELHLVGNPFLVAAAFERLLALGAEPAGPGEFTRRAFANGRIDLTRAEGILALIHARDRDERRAATALLAGGLDERLVALRDGLEDLRALAEASLDFDESDTGHVPADELEARRAALAARVDEALAWETRRAPRGGEARLVLAGAPNAGKSSLFNALVGTAAPDDRARRSIVSELAGTTRDSREDRLVVDGVDCRLVDTAGLEAAASGVDAAAQARTEHERRGADLELRVVDAAAPGELPAADPELPRLVVWNKLDRADARRAPAGAVPVSARDGRGLDELRAAIARALGLRPSDAPPAPGSGRPGLGRELQARHREALRLAAAELEAAGAGLANGLPLDLFAEHLRGATAALDRITGATTPEELLGRIFARFCIGK